MQITVKLYFQDEIRRVSIGDQNGDLTISHLKNTVDTIFPALMHGDYRLLWKDEDGDFVTISSNSEFLDAVTEMTVSGLAKFHIKAISKTVDQSPASDVADKEQCVASSSEFDSVHDGVQCDECGVIPIVGARYKCSVRNDFDLCAACEAKCPQPHPMIKMNTPKRSFSLFRGFSAFGGRSGRGGGRLGGRFEGGGGRFRGCFGGGGAASHPPPPPPHGGPFEPFPHHPPGPHGPFHHGPFGGRGRGCEWREALRRRMERDPQPHSQDTSPSVATAARSVTVESPAVHINVGCDGCRMMPIVGTRYKCAVRENYDLCADCESRRCTDRGLTGKDLFPMLKIDRPEQAPGTFVYIFNKRAVHGCHPGRSHGPPHGHHGHHHGGRHGVESVYTAVHRHVNCDHCGAHPIMGPRFKCAVRPDFDLCATCAATVPQPYPMVKIYHPQHRPSTIVYAAALSTTAVQAANANQNASLEVHEGVQCDECNVCPIVGTRFQCTGRSDYDLCGACEALKTHQPFPMIKITDSSQRPKSVVYEVRGGKAVATRALTHPCVQAGIRCDECHQSPILGPRYKCAVRDDFDLCSACEAKRTQPYPMVKIYDPQHHPSKLVFAFYDRLVPSTTAPTRAVPHVPTVPSASPNLVRPSLRFVRDRSLPDGTVVQPGQSGLRKIWDVRNDGLHAWPAGSTLVFCGGDVLHTGSTVVTEPVRLLKPGEEGQLAVSLTGVPEKDGRYVSYFRMQTTEGQYFGQRLWADIVVTKPVASAPEAITPSVQHSAFIQAMDEHMNRPNSSPVCESSPFIQGMDEHMKELQRLDTLARQAQEQEDRMLAEELEQLQLQNVQGAADEEEEEQLLQQVMTELQQQQAVSMVLETSSAPALSDVVPDSSAPTPLQVSVAVEPVDCVPALASLSPVPSEKDENKELTEGWAVLVATTGDKEDGSCEYLLEEPEDDTDDCASEYSAGVHQPASTSSSALLGGSSLIASSMMTASYANACADLDLDDGSQHSQRDHQDEDSSAAVECKEPDPIEPVMASTTGLSEDSAQALYQRELQMLAEMGFADVSVLVPLLQKHLRAQVEGGGVDAQGLHGVLAELLN